MQTKHEVKQYVAQVNIIVAAESDYEAAEIVGSTIESAMASPDPQQALEMFTDLGSDIVYGKNDIREWGYDPNYDPDGDVCTVMLAEASDHDMARIRNSYEAAADVYIEAEVASKLINAGQVKNLWKCEED
jgi:hypothetical protein